MQAAAGCVPCSSDERAAHARNQPTLSCNSEFTLQTSEQRHGGHDFIGIYMREGDLKTLYEAVHFLLCATSI